MALWRRRRSLEPENPPDRVLDVNARFPFRDLRFLFCEHFIDHLQAR